MRSINIVDFGGARGFHGPRLPFKWLQINSDQLGLDFVARPAALHSVLPQARPHGTGEREEVRGWVMCGADIVAHLECEAEAGAPPPSLSTSLGARTPDAPGESILTSARLLKRETYRGRPLEAREALHKTICRHGKLGVVRSPTHGPATGVIHPIDAGYTPDRAKMHCANPGALVVQSG